MWEPLDPKQGVKYPDRDLVDPTYSLGARRSTGACAGSGHGMNGQ